MPDKENATKVSENEFQNFIANEKAKLVVVDFFASWCMPCTMMAPVIEELAKKNLKKGVIFGKLNVDEAPELSTKYEVSSIPCIIFFKRGKEAARIVGAISPDKLQKKIDELV